MQHTRRCDWESFRGRDELLDKIRRTVPPWDKELVEDTRRRVRKEHDVVLPPCWIRSNIIHEHGKDLEGSIEHWRKNKDKYPPMSQWAALTEALREIGNVQWNYWDSSVQLLEWAESTMRDLADPVIQEERRKQREEEARRKKEAEYQEALKNPRSIESYFARIRESKRRQKEEEARAAMVASGSKFGITAVSTDEVMTGVNDDVEGLYTCSA